MDNELKIDETIQVELFEDFFYLKKHLLKHSNYIIMIIII